jgi:[protein-PII] uridylyltransferase
VGIDLDASNTSTVVEVHADDAVGLLARIASVFAELSFDVTIAKVATLGERVVDVFYVRDAPGAKVTDAATLDRLRSELLRRLTRDEALDSSA